MTKKRRKKRLRRREREEEKMREHFEGVSPFVYPGECAWT